MGKAVFFSIFCFVFVLHLEAQDNPLHQKVTLIVNDATLKETFDILSHQTGLNFTYGNDVTLFSKKYTLDKNDISLEELLKILLKDTDLQYKLNGNNILIGRKKRDRIISGYIEDQNSGERLIQANIYDFKSSRGTASNVYGFFSLPLPEDSITVRVSYIGYHPVYLNTFNREDTFLIIKLESTLNLAEVVVESREQPQHQSQMSAFDLPVEQLKSIPSLAGEADLMKNIQLLPGIKQGNEGSAGIYVRGGGPDQNLILLDGVPVYNISHMLGLFSIFNADAINSIRVIKGGYPARYGGRLSSVLDIRMKEGNMSEIHGEGSVGIIAAKLSLEGPIIKDQTSFMISGRRTYGDLLLKPILKLATRSSGGEIKLGYYFYDINAKVNHKFSDKDRLYLSVYSGQDKFYSGSVTTFSDTIIDVKSVDRTSLFWGNTIAAARWNHLFNKKLFSNATITYSRYQFDVVSKLNETVEPASAQINLQNYSYSFFSGVEDFSARYDLDFVPKANHYIRTGAYATYHLFKPGGSSATSDTAISVIEPILIDIDPINALEIAAYIEDDWDISKRWKANIGIHTSMFNVKEKTYTSVQPRISSTLLLYKNVAFKASFATMSQYLHLLSSSGFGLPTDLWVPPTDKVKPQNSWQTAVGIVTTFKNTLEVSVEGYYKEMNNLINYKEGSDFTDIEGNFDENVISGRGNSYGTEILLNKSRGKSTGWVGYTLSWTNRQFEELNNGKEFPYRYDRRHDISITFSRQISKKSKFGATWVYSTGNAITVPSTEYLLFPQENIYYPSSGGLNGIFNTAVDYGGTNSYRMPSYHRLDIGWTITNTRRWGESSWNFSIYNVYGRRNIYYIFYRKDPYGVNKFRAVSLFPFIPSINYSFKF